MICAVTIKPVGFRTAFDEVEKWGVVWMGVYSYGSHTVSDSVLKFAAGASVFLGFSFCFTALAVGKVSTSAGGVVSNGVGELASIVSG